MATKICCAGCLKNLKSKSYLKCAKCNSAYDLTCANVSEQRFSYFYGGGGAEKSNKREWICPLCKAKKPKDGNTDTPVRSDGGILDTSAEVDDDNHEDNITLRRKPTSSTLASGTIADAGLIELIKTEIRRSVRAEMSPMTKRLDDLQSAVQHMSSQYDDLIKINKTIVNDCKNLQQEHSILQSTVAALTERINSMEQHMRDTNLEIQGVPQHKTENVVNIVNKIADVVSHKISDNDILNCTRVASINKDSKRPRAIVVKLRSTRCRDDFYSAVARYNRSNPDDKLNSKLIGISGDAAPIYIAEHLAPANKALHAAARARAKEIAYKFVWVRNGRIFVRKNETSPFIHVKNIDVLNALRK